MPHHKQRLDLNTSVAPRQVAILLESLPERTHRVLLGQLGPEEKQAVLEQSTSLGEVDAMEKYRVLKLMFEQLQAETESVEKVESEIQDEIQIGRARVAKKRSPSIYRPHDSTNDNASASENATHESPSGAAADGPSVQAAEGDEASTSPHVIPYTPAETGPHPASEQASSKLHAIFAQFQQTQAAGVLPFASQWEATQHADDCTIQSAWPHNPRPHSPRPYNDPRHHQAHVAPPHDNRASHEPLGATRNASPSDASITHAVPADNDGNSVPYEATTVQLGPDDAEELAQRVDRFLTQLNPSQLCRALGLVSTKEAFLVLCGLPNETAEQVLELLPRRQSRKVRQDMRRMGQLQLSEIDRAKQAVAAIALRLASHQEALAA